MVARLPKGWTGDEPVRPRAPAENGACRDLGIACDYTPLAVLGECGDAFTFFVCQACFGSRRCKFSAGRGDRNREARPGCPPRGGI